MTVNVLVLGGTHHVGRCAVEAALALGDEVTTLNRGLTGHLTPMVTSLLADRTNDQEFARGLGSREWDLVIDTWSGAPRVVESSAQHLVHRTKIYAYVSSRSVYQWPMAELLDESGTLVDGRPDAEATDYAADKRGGEMAVLEMFADRALIARPGLIIGPYEQVGRLPWWLARVSRGGRVLAPGPGDRPLQFIDGRDLAEWILRRSRDQIGGIFNTVSKPGHATMAMLLDSCREVANPDAELIWMTPQEIESEHLAAWTELPIWLPPVGESAPLHSGDVSKALAAGLHCRPVTHTVADTWAWLQKEGWPTASPGIGISFARESEILTRLRPINS